MELIWLTALHVGPRIHSHVTAHTHTHTDTAVCSCSPFCSSHLSQPASQLARPLLSFLTFMKCPTGQLLDFKRLWHCDYCKKDFHFMKMSLSCNILVLLKDKVSHVNMLCSLGSLTNFALTRLLFPLHVMLSTSTSRSPGIIRFFCFTSILWLPSESTLCHSVLVILLQNNPHLMLIFNPEFPNSSTRSSKRGRAFYSFESRSLSCS